MNRKIFSITATLALVMTAGVASVYAQQAGVKAHVPFAFAVSSSTLPAGDYTFNQLSQSIWEIRGDAGGPAIFSLARPDGTNADVAPAKLVFKQCGERYFLSEVRSLGETSSIPASKAERALEREMARNGSTPERLYVLASIR
jgi:hypothetical protein